NVSGHIDDFDVYSRRYEWTGNQLVALDAAEGRVNTTTDGRNGVGYSTMSVQMSAAALTQGGYVVVWAKFTSNTQSEIYAQTYDAAGNRLGGETLVSTDVGPVNVIPKVTALGDGGY